jgi:tetratricopeptide (TPR) repeat protein
MKCITYLALILFSLLSNVCGAEWMSDVDKKYDENNPQLYAKVAQAKELISSAHGNTELSYQALELLISVIKTDEKFAPAYVQLARVTSNLGYQVNNIFDGTALRSQEEYIKRALALEPKYDYAIAMMGYTRMFQGNLDEAEKYYTQAVELKSGYPYLKAQMAQLATKRGNYTKAIELATQGYEQNISEPKIAAGIINELIFAYQKMQGDHTKELEKWQAKRTELDPSVAWNWGDHARFRLYYLGDYNNAIKYGTKALSLMNYGVGQYLVAAAYYTKWNDLKEVPARKAEAEKAFKIASSIHPDTKDMSDEFMKVPMLRSTGAALTARRLSGKQ